MGVVIHLLSTMDIPVYSWFVPKRVAILRLAFWWSFWQQMRQTLTPTQKTHVSKRNSTYYTWDDCIIFKLPTQPPQKSEILVPRAFGSFALSPPTLHGKSFSNNALLSRPYKGLRYQGESWHEGAICHQSLGHLQGFSLRHLEASINNGLGIHGSE